MAISLHKLDNDGRYAIGRGFIHGRDPSGRPVYCVFVAVATKQKLLFLKSHFSFEPIDQDLPWSAMLPLLNMAGDSGDTTLARYEHELYDFIDLNRIFQTDRMDFDVKAIERKITYFCSDVLDINAITFVEANMIPKEEVFSVMPFLRDMEKAAEEEVADGEGKPQEPAEAVEESSDGSEGDDGEETDTLTLKCEPLLDPVSGVSLTELNVGDAVYCRLPNDSPFFKLFESNVPNYDGTLIGTITGVRINDYGTAIVAVELAEGIAGVIKLSGKVRIKLAVTANCTRHHGGPHGAIPFEVMIAGAALLFLLYLIAVLVYIFS